MEVFGDPTRPHMSTRTAGPHGPAVFGDRCSWADGNGCESGCAKCRPRREAPVSVNCRARPLRSDASCRGMAFAVALHVTTDQEAGVRVLGRASSRPSTADSTGRQLRFQLRWGLWRPTLASANPLKARWPPPAANGQLALRSRSAGIAVQPLASPRNTARVYHQAQRRAKATARAPQPTAPHKTVAAHPRLCATRLCPAHPFGLERRESSATMASRSCRRVAETK